LPVAATGSNPAGRRDDRRLSRRVSLRLRLTLLYGACFLAAGAAVLGITYVLFAHDTLGQTRQLQVPGPELRAGGSGQQAVIAVEGGGLTAQFKVPLDQVLPKSKFSAPQLKQIRAAALVTSQCIRSHGFPNWPNMVVAPDLPTGDLEFGYAKQLSTAQDLDLLHQGSDSQRFGAIYAGCARPLSTAIDRVPGASKDIGSTTSLETNVKAVIEHANAALVTQRTRSLSTLLTWSGVALGAVTVISVLLGWLLAGKALAPMRMMTARARKINEETLHERLSEDPGEDELGQFAATFDDVLARLERAFTAHKRFVANASHELRTPVTLERALLELALSSPGADAETRHTMERLLASNQQQEKMIDALLILARSQGGTDTDSAVDLAELAQDAIDLREPQLADITVAADLHPAPLRGDPALLERLISNLVDNAIVHNLGDGAWITVETGNESTGSWLCVSNSGPEVPESTLPEMFEPFRRGEGARTATVPGFGLGLSIVQAIIDVHGATVTAQQVDGGGLSVEVRF
jgi:signal transduction histidine kinase